MRRPLAAHVVLVVEDEPLIAMEVVEAVEEAGARCLRARTIADALRMAEDSPLSAAILDHGLNEGDTSEVCAKLKERDIPFIIYSGHSNIEGVCSEGQLVPKPVAPQLLVSSLVALLRDRKPLH